MMEISSLKTAVTMSFDPRLLDGVLVCTKSKSRLIRDGEFLVCSDSDCRMRFEIKDGIPNMLLEEASLLSPEDWSSLMQRLDPQNSSNGQ